MKIKITETETYRYYNVEFDTYTIFAGFGHEHDREFWIEKKDCPNCTGKCSDCYIYEYLKTFYDGRKGLRVIEDFEDLNIALKQNDLPKLTDKEIKELREYEK